MTNEIKKRLRTYASLDGSELGESIDAMLEVLQYEPYINDHVIRTIEAELMDIYDWFEENTKIVKREHMVKKHYFELEYVC